MFPFLMISVMNSRTLYLDCFLKVGIWKVQYCTLWDCKKKKVIHSNNCHCNDVSPGGKPDKIEDLPFALSGKGLQVRALGEEWKGSWGMCIWDAVLDLQSDVLHLELPVPGGCELRRCSGALHVQPGIPVLLRSLSPRHSTNLVPVWYLTPVSLEWTYFCSPDCKLETSSQLLFFLFLKKKK